MLGTNVSPSGFQKHGLVEASPDVLGGVNQVLDATRDPVDSETSGVRVGEFGGFRYMRC